MAGVGGFRLLVRMKSFECRLAPAAGVLTVHSAQAQALRSDAGFAGLAGIAQGGCKLSARGFAASAGFSRKDVIYNIENTSDPEAEAAVRAYQRKQFAAASKGAPAAAAPEPELELTAKIERKYKAAQIVETGIQNIHVPLSYASAGGKTALKRFAAQLSAVGAQAGFASPDAELAQRLSEKASGATSLKELLGRIRPYCSADLHAALLDAAAAAEAETGAPVTADGTSAGYKAFADKVKKVAQEHKLPWQVLVSYKTKLGTADEATRDTLTRDYQAWLQSAQLADVTAEVEDLKAEAARLLDTQLSKSAAAVRKEQEAALAALQRKLEASKGSPWAAAVKEDLAYQAWFDAQVAKDPVNGPRAAA